MTCPRFTPYFRRRRFGMRASGGFLPSDIARIYGFPKVSPKTAPVIAILELGGGYTQADVNSSFAAMGLPVPNITNVSVQGATNTPGNDADGEVELDIQVAAGAYSYCTGQAANVVMIWCPNSDTGFSQGIAAAAQHGASVLSISWGGSEDQSTASFTQSMEAALSSTLSSGCIIFAASGDNDSGDGESGTHVDYPASSQYVVGCGGTTLTVSGSGYSETVWNDGQGDGTGGGYSALFSTPSFQKSLSLASRGVPDVSGNADPNTGYTIWIDGSSQVIGGTSAVAPLWAGLTASCIAGGASPGSVFTRLYGNPTAFSDITSGNNGAYKAGLGWDPCTGLGSPKGNLILSALSGTGTPTPPPVNPPPTNNPPPVNPPPNPITIYGDLKVTSPLSTGFFTLRGFNKGHATLTISKSLPIGDYQVASSVSTQDHIGLPGHPVLTQLLGLLEQLLQGWLGGGGVTQQPTPSFKQRTPGWLLNLLNLAGSVGISISTVLSIIEKDGPAAISIVEQIIADLQSGLSSTQQ